MGDTNGVPAISLFSALGACAVSYAAWRVYSYVAIQRRLTGHIPGSTCLFMPLSVPGLMFPPAGDFWNPAILYTWNFRHTLYDNYKIRLFSKTAVVDHSTLVYSADPHVFQQACDPGSVWEKPEWAMKDMAVLGPNIVTSDGETWKRFRRISAPAFTEETHQDVWIATVNVYKNILDKEGWDGKDSVDVTEMYNLLRKVTLHVFLVVGYNLHPAWDRDVNRTKSGRLSVYKMMLEVTESILLRSRVPGWVYKLRVSPKLDVVNEAYTSFVSFMHERITDCESELSKEDSIDLEPDRPKPSLKKQDIFTRLVSARRSMSKNSEDNVDSMYMTDEELIGNLFLFMVDAHEALAHAMTAALALLATDQDMQERVYQEIQSVLGGREPTYGDFESLDIVLSCLYEALRLYPSAYCMVREAKKDTVLKVPHQKDPEIIENVIIKEGTQLILDGIGIGYDKIRYPEPCKFDPFRWVSSSNHFRQNINTPSDILSFSIGPRSCLGRKFASVEAVAFLTNLLQDWRVEVMELKNGESKEMWRERVLDRPKMAISLTFGDEEGRVPLRIVTRAAR